MINVHNSVTIQSSQVGCLVDLTGAVRILI